MTWCLPWDRWLDRQNLLHFGIAPKGPHNPAQAERSTALGRVKPLPGRSRVRPSRKWESDGSRRNEQSDQLAHERLVTS